MIADMNLSCGKTIKALHMIDFSESLSADKRFYATQLCCHGSVESPARSVAAHAQLLGLCCVGKRQAHAVRDCTNTTILMRLQTRRNLAATQRVIRTPLSRTLRAASLKPRSPHSAQLQKCENKPGPTRRSA